jgi:hypothetical protein
MEFVRLLERIVAIILLVIAIIIWGIMEGKN